MKKILTLLVMMLFVVGCAAFVWAGEQTAPAQPVKAASVQKAPAKEAEIVSINTTADTITVKYKSGVTETLKIDPKVIVTKAGKTIPLNALTTGEAVYVRCTTKEGQKIVTKITVKVLHERQVPKVKKEETAPATK